MSTPLRVLIVEDNEDDAELLLRALQRGGFDPIFRRVETPEDMRAALEQDNWDIVISDWAMPRFDATAAYSVLQEKTLDLPFIIVSGTIGEDTAVKALKAGVHDFMTKGQLTRLIPAIERELREAANRKEARKIQTQLLISERMASLGTLAAGIAHEINNPLAVLIANLDSLQESLTGITKENPPNLSGDARGEASQEFFSRLENQAPEMSENLRDANEAAERIRVIVRDLKIFSRASDEEKRGSVELHGVLESSIRMASNEVRHRARLVKDYGEIVPVEGQESQLGQVFLNLIVNAAQAIPEGNAAANEIRIVTRMGDAGGVAVEIRDTGAGIPRDILPRIFDPFFTTKPTGIGTGLGLAISRRIITSLGGELSVASEVGKGSVFRILLPAARSQKAEVMPVAAPAPTGRRGSILVVDDEPKMCGVIQNMLRGDHDVTAVTSAKDALRLLTEGGRFDVILCDLMMPEMTGMDLHAELHRLAPDQTNKMIFMTGGAFTQNAQGFLNQISNATIEKPFTRTVMRNAVQGLLSQ